MKIALEEFRKMLEYFQAINSTNLEELEYFENGKKIQIPEQVIHEWKYFGLNNKHFIEKVVLQGPPYIY